MARRKSLFELLIENENVNLEIEYNILNKLLTESSIIGAFDSIYDAIDRYVLPDWKYSCRCIKLNDLRKKIGIQHSSICRSNYDIEYCLLFFELIYNLVQELIIKYNKGEICVNKESILYKVIKNIEEILEELNYSIEKIEDRYVIVEKDAVLTSIAEKNLNICSDVIEYRRFNLKGDIETKKAIILKLADKIEPLKIKFKGNNYNSLMDDVQMLLNNLNLRHNNLNGKNKKEIIVKMSDEELEIWYDRVYDMILAVLQIDDYLDNSNEIEKLKKKLK